METHPKIALVFLLFGKWRKKVVQYITLEFLPPNSTFRSQALDMGIIAAGSV